jgi:hypothetical protein
MRFSASLGMVVGLFLFGCRRDDDHGAAALNQALAEAEADDTTALHKSTDSIMQVMTPAVIRRSTAEELALPVALMRALPLDHDRSAWLSLAGTRLNALSLAGTRWDAPMSQQAPIAAAPVMPQRSPGSHRRCMSPEGKPEGGFETLIANVVPGKPLFLGSDCSEVGVIADIESDHRFPDGTNRDAVLISFKDGSADWVPRKTAQMLYVTR